MRDIVSRRLITRQEKTRQRKAAKLKEAMRALMAANRAAVHRRSDKPHAYSFFGHSQMRSKLAARRKRHDTLLAKLEAIPRFPLGPIGRRRSERMFRAVHKVKNVPITRVRGVRRRHKRLGLL